MNIVILAGGKGERLGELTQNTNKCLLEILPEYRILETFPPWNLIDFSILNALRLVNPNIFIVLGYKAGSVREYIAKRWKLGLDKIHFRYQSKDTTIGAIQVVEKDIEGDFLLMLGDEILVDDKLLSMTSYSYFNKDKFCGTIGFAPEYKSEEIKKTYSIELDDQDNVSMLTEKPKIVYSRFKGTGNCILPQEFFIWAKEVQNYDVQDFVSCIQYGINKGFVFRPFQVCKKYFNINTPEDYRLAKEFFKEKEKND